MRDRVPPSADRMKLRRTIEDVERTARLGGYTPRQFWLLAHRACPLDPGDPLRGLWMEEMNTASLRYALYCATDQARIARIIETVGMGDLLERAQHPPAGPLVTQTCTRCLRTPCECHRFSRWYRGLTADGVYRDEYED